MQARMASTEFFLEASRCQMEMRWELKRTERPTPQSWSSMIIHVSMGGCGAWKWGRNTHTVVKDTLEGFADGQELDTVPDIRANALWDAEGPAAAKDVTAVLPDGAETGLEEVDGLAHLDVVDGGVIVVAPEVLDGLDLFAQLIELGGVRLGVVALSRFLDMAVEVNVPVVLGGQGPHRLEEVALRIVALFGGRVGIGRLGEAGEATGEELRARRHDGRATTLAMLSEQG